MDSPILRRIQQQTGLVSLLAKEMPLSDLHSLLLAVFKQRSQALEPKHVQARRDSLTGPSAVSARLFARFDQCAFDAAADFEALDLSPVAPFGTAAVLGGIDQANVLTTIRGAELLGDPTPVLALECARRRKTSAAEVRVCASHRLIRLQRVDFPGFTQHFRLFGMASAGRDTGSHQFEIRHLGEHIRVYLELFRRLNRAGFRLSDPLVEISDPDAVRRALTRAGVDPEDVRQAVRAHLPGSGERFLAERGVQLNSGAGPVLERIGQALFEPLRQDYPEAEFRFDPARLEGLAFYSGLTMRIAPRAPDGERYPIVDGGMTDWTARLMADRKQRLMTSGIGSEFVCKRYLAAG